MLQELERISSGTRNDELLKEDEVTNAQNIESKGVGGVL
jgi:hypothetical protein